MTVKLYSTAPLDITSKYSIVFLFSILSPPALAVIKDNERTSVDEEMLSSLLNIACSTSRGILYTRFLGTVLEGPNFLSQRIKPRRGRIAYFFRSTEVATAMTRPSDPTAL